MDQCDGGVAKRQEVGRVWSLQAHRHLGSRGHVADGREGLFIVAIRRATTQLNDHGSFIYI
jgi:hypothetical protein